eukprot:gene13003-14342_t
MAEKADVDSEEQLSKEDEEFKEETENIFKGFMYHRLTSRIEQEADGGHFSVGQIPKPVLQELETVSSQEEKKSKEQQVLGKTLAEMGDQLNRKYHSQLVDMTKSLGLTSETAYATFAKIAKRLFQNGINWGRIVALLCFGYEIAMSVIKSKTRSVGTFLKKIVNFVVSFIIQEKISNWIANHGGWVCVKHLL